MRISAIPYFRDWVIAKVYTHNWNFVDLLFPLAYNLLFEGKCWNWQTGMT